MSALVLTLAADVFELQREGNIAPFLIVFVFGMAVGMVGHLLASRDLILAGILIAGVTAVLPWLMWS
ncbi:MAG: hypothetical protein MUC84_11800 [Solirubrobacteraceae bacterium]|jgi:hypothetical protein|nr:hypothetical protein [Solirubrobacteraceae bacterium]MCU0314729.1 hypothetical protein [Solirubrobacteraceae bacterium]